MLVKIVRDQDDMGSEELNQSTFCIFAREKKMTKLLFDDMLSPSLPILMCMDVLEG